MFYDLGPSLKLLFYKNEIFRVFFFCCHSSLFVRLWLNRLYGFCSVLTDNPLYTNTRYNDKIRYNDNLNVTKPSLKRGQLMRNYA